MKGNGRPAGHSFQVIHVPGSPGEVIECELRGFKKVEFSRHALEQMKIRGLKKSEVLETIRNPSKTGLPTQPNRKRFRTFCANNRARDVVFEEGGDRIVVVTAMNVDLPVKDRQKKKRRRR